jgi:caffeoyl-CoA O-methyltransferase
VSSSDRIGRRALLGIPLITLPFATAWAWAQGRRGRPGTTLPPPVPKSDAERRILDVIAAYDQSQRPGSMSVPFEDGRLLRILAESIGAQHVVEIGTSFGYSGLWLALALVGTGGRLTTFEIDPARQARARANFEKAGVLPRMTLVVGDAHAEVTKVKPPLDMVFSDADKEGYLDYFQKLSPVLRPGGLFVTHNIDMAQADYVRAITTDPGFETTMVDVGAGEVAVTLRKR